MTGKSKGYIYMYIYIYIYLSFVFFYIHSWLLFFFFSISEILVPMENFQKIDLLQFMNNFILVAKPKTFANMHLLHSIAIIMEQVCTNNSSIHIIFFSFAIKFFFVVCFLNSRFHWIYACCCNDTIRWSWWTSRFGIRYVWL